MDTQSVANWLISERKLEWSLTAVVVGGRRCRVVVMEKGHCINATGLIPGAKMQQLGGSCSVRGAWGMSLIFLCGRQGMTVISKENL